MTPEDAYDLLDSIAQINCLEANLHLVKKTEKENEEERQAKEIRHRMSHFTFTKLGIKPGTLLAYVKDPSITVEVIDDRLVRFKGNETSLSAVAAELLSPAKGKYNGAMYFTYNDETIWDLRGRIENIDEEQSLE